MSKKVITLEKNKLIKDAVRIMAEKSLSCVVITEKNKPVGMVTERDMVKKVLDKGIDINNVKLESVMTSPIITVNPDIDVFTAAELMKKNKIRRLVILEDYRLGGLITESDISGLIVDVSVRSMFHKINLQKDLEIAKLRMEAKNKKPE
jgi:CBS domain-containing protein